MPKIYNKTKNIKHYPKVSLKPGENILTDKEYELLKKDSYFQKELEEKKLDVEKIEDPIKELLSKNIGQIKEALEKLKDKDLLNKILEAEKSGDNRTGCVNVIEERIKQLEG